jgi:hypothetical protein
MPWPHGSGCNATSANNSNSADVTSALNMKAVSLYETSVIISSTARCQNPEPRRPFFKSSPLWKLQDSYFRFWKQDEMLRNVNCFMFFSLTSLLADCVSSSFQLKEEYLVWNKWRTAYSCTRIKPGSFELERKPLRYYPLFCACIGGGVRLGMSDSVLKDSRHATFQRYTAPFPVQFTDQYGWTADESRSN